MICSDFVATEPEKFTRHALNFAHAKTERHQPGANRHQASAHQPRESAIAAGSRNRSLGTRNLVDQGLNLVGGALGAEKTQNDADGFFSDSAIDTDLGGQSPYQFVHICPVPKPALPVVYLQIDLERLRPEIQAIRGCEGPDRLASVAAMQE
ncbi:hypothetical protein V1292_006338 [Bradyrhizobium sp. AZCC 1719]